MERGAGWRAGPSRRVQRSKFSRCILDVDDADTLPDLDMTTLQQPGIAAAETGHSIALSVGQQRSR